MLVILGSLRNISDDAWMDEMNKVPSRTPPAALQRALYEEAGYRCAIPTCRSTSVLEMAHITPWSEVLVHEFENIIVLCSNCHGLFDREKKIPERSIRNYKSNLGILNGRYNDFERRMLDQWHEQGLGSIIRLEVGASVVLHTRNLIGDGLATCLPAPGAPSTVMLPGGGTGIVFGGTFDSGDGPALPRINITQDRRTTGLDDYSLTEKGHVFVQHFFGAKQLP